jgi:hypothetical protein
LDAAEEAAEAAAAAAAAADAAGWCPLVTRLALDHRPALITCLSTHFALVDWITNQPALVWTVRFRPDLVLTNHLHSH